MPDTLHESTRGVFFVSMASCSIASLSSWEFSNNRKIGQTESHLLYQWKWKCIILTFGSSDLEECSKPLLVVWWAAILTRVLPVNVHTVEFMETQEQQCRTDESIPGLWCGYHSNESKVQKETCLINSRLMFWVGSDIIMSCYIILTDWRHWPILQQTARSSTQDSYSKKFKQHEIDQFNCSMKV